MKYDDVVQVRVDKNLKRQAQKVYDKLNLDLTAAVRLFLQQSVLQNGLPFGMVNLDASEGTCNNVVTRSLLISQGRAWEVSRTEKTCRLGGLAPAKSLEED